MEDIIPCAVESQEIFQRVWQRVMAGRDNAQCPIESIPPNMQGDLSCECLESLLRQGGGAPKKCERQGAEEAPVPAQPMEEQPAPAPSAEEQPAPAPPAEEQPAPAPPAEEQPAPAPPVEPGELPAADGPHRDSDLPHLWEEPQETSDRTACLRRQVMEALEGWQFYRHLAKRARGNDARTLNSMAGALHRNARKLSAAYFLLTGLRYWPSELLSAPAIPSYWGALRTRHQTEQRQETAFRTAADSWDDPNLLELYQALVEGCQTRCRQLRSLLEQDGT